MTRHHIRTTPRPPRTVRVGGLGAFALAALVAASPAAAQDSGHGFLLGTPVGSLAIRGGYDRATAGSDLFAFTTRELTLSKGDFAGLSLAGEIGVRMSDRFDFVLGAGYSGSTAQSEFRHYIDNDDLPIEQTTSFRRVPITAGVKAYLAPRGRSVGQFAWIPTRFSPYVAAGGGIMWYRFRQEGDFVDFDTPEKRVFTHTFESSRWTTVAHGAAGADYTLSPRVALTGEARYTFGRGPLASDFSGFHRIDVSGLAATAGIAVRF
jgi:opacity protein-like surface antigen